MKKNSPAPYSSLQALPAMSILLCCLLFSSFAVAQHYTPADSAKVEGLISDCSDSLTHDPAAAFQLALKAADAARRSGYNSGYATALESQGIALVYQGKADEALAAFAQALKLSDANGFHSRSAAIHQQIAIVYDERSDFKTAIAQYDTALRLLTISGDSVARANLYADMGRMMNHMRDFSKASEYFMKAANTFAALHMSMRLSVIYLNMGGNYISDKKYPEAFEYLTRALHISDSLKVSDNMPVAYMNLALYYDMTHKKDSAIRNYVKALDLFKRVKDIQNEAILLSDIGSLYTEMDKPVEAEKYFKQSLQMAKQASNPTIVQLDYYNLAILYHRIGNFHSAFQYMDSSALMRDSLYSQDKASALEELTTKYETKEIAQKNSLLQRENAVQVLKLQRKNILIYSVFGAAILFLLIGILLLRQSRLKAAQQKMELEQKQLLAQINPHFIYNCLNSIQQFVVQNDIINANKYLADFALLMRQTLDNSKDGIISLSREIDYLENYLSFEHMRFEDKFSYSIDSAADLDPEEIEIPSMIIQPFVENAVKHGLFNLEGRPGVLTINFYREQGALYCKVDDNGIGMQAAQKLKEQAFLKYQSHGMELTRKRLALVSKLHSSEYEVSIINKEDRGAHGTTVIIKFPLQA